MKGPHSTKEGISGNRLDFSASTHATAVTDLAETTKPQGERDALEIPVKLRGDDQAGQAKITDLA